MNGKNVGILAIAGGFLLIWGGATGRLGNAWGALVHGTSASSPGSPQTSATPDTGTTPSGANFGCPEGQTMGDGGVCVPLTGGQDGPSTRGLTHSLATNGLMSFSGSGSV
jgi:hypothetical protein